MAKLTKKQFEDRSKTDVVPVEISDTDKEQLISNVYDWQQKENIYAWDNESLQKDLGFSVKAFIISGTIKDQLVEIEFLQPLDEDVVYEGVAHGYRLTQMGDYYNLKKDEISEEDNENEDTEEEE